MLEFINTERFLNEIFDYKVEEEFKFKGKIPVILNFSASWCGPCKSFAPILEQLSKDYAGKLHVYKVDIDKDPELADVFEIQSVPTTLFIDSRNEPMGINGYKELATMKKAIEAYIQF